MLDSGALHTNERTGGTVGSGADGRATSTRLQVSVSAKMDATRSAVALERAQRRMCKKNYQHNNTLSLSHTHGLAGSQSLLRVNIRHHFPDSNYRAGFGQLRTNGCHVGVPLTRTSRPVKPSGPLRRGSLASVNCYVQREASSCRKAAGP